MNSCVCPFMVAGRFLVRNGIVSYKICRGHQNHVLRSTLK